MNSGKPDKMTVNGKLVAWVSFIFGSLVSIAGNVLASRIPPAGAVPDWQPSMAAQIGAAVWPIALLLAVEVLSRVRWPAGAWWTVARYGGVVGVALGSAAISYGHIRAVLISWGYDSISAGVGPLVLDGLMVVAGFAVLATSTHHQAAGSTAAASSPTVVPVPDPVPVPSPQVTASPIDEPTPTVPAVVPAYPAGPDPDPADPGRTRTDPADPDPAPTPSRELDPLTLPLDPGPDPVPAAVPAPRAAADPDPVDPAFDPELVAVARVVFNELTGRGQRPSRDRLAAELRARNIPIRTNTAGAVLKFLREKAA